MTTDNSAARTGGRSTSARAAALPPSERRAGIVAAATPLLRQHGLDVTTRQIAEAAGIAEGTIFRVFANKQAIVDAVLADACDLTETLEQIRALDRTAPLPERVRSCVTIVADQMATMIELMIALRRGGPARPPRSRGAGAEHRRRQQRHRELVSAIAAVLEPDAAQLAYPPERAAMLLRQLTVAGTHRMAADGDPLTPAEITDVLLHGIARSAPDERGLPPPASGG